VALVDGRRGALGAFLMMKRGCRVGLVVPTVGAELARPVLSRFDPGIVVDPAPDDPSTWGRSLSTLADKVRADGVVLPLRVEEFAAARQEWGERLVFSPTIGFSDEEVDGRWRNLTALAA
jgi:hypothetical protein